MSLALNYQRRADKRLAIPKGVSAPSRSPSPRVVENSPAPQKKLITTIDYNDPVISSIKAKLSEHQALYKELKTKSPPGSPLLMNNAKKMDRELNAWLYQTMSATPAKLQPPYGVLETTRDSQHIVRDDK
jgi:hypothetical protein